ncbi:MAG: hypothetical protein ACYC99_10985 [Candidatus Geothermincolia bacterium]
MADYPQGSVVTVAADVMVNGVPAFARGEQVTIQQVAPNPQRPEYKYTVYSARLSQWYQLRDQDILAQGQAAQPAPPPAAAPQAGARPAGGGLDFGAMETSDWLIGIGGLVLFFGTFFYLWGFGFFSLLLGPGLVVLVVLDKLVKVPAISEWRGLTWLYIIVGGVATLLGAISLLRLLLWLHGLISISWYFTPVLTLLASIAVLIGGIMRQKEGV